jgi:hypothetical protein
VDSQSMGVTRKTTLTQPARILLRSLTHTAALSPIHTGICSPTPPSPSHIICISQRSISWSLEVDGCG